MFGVGAKTTDVTSIGSSDSLAGLTDDISEYTGTLVGVTVNISLMATSSCLSHDSANKTKTKIADTYACFISHILQ